MSGDIQVSSVTDLIALVMQFRSKMFTDTFDTKWNILNELYEDQFLHIHEYKKWHMYSMC